MGPLKDSQGVSRHYRFSHKIQKNLMDSCIVLPMYCIPSSSLNILGDRKYLLVCNIRKRYRLSDESNLWHPIDLRENRSYLLLIQAHFKLEAKFDNNAFLK